MAYNRGERPDSPMKRRGGRRRKKVCVFCGKDNVIEAVAHCDEGGLNHLHLDILLITPEGRLSS